jgi:prepilin-type N-terminal cleavage/methylation domain-containing protein
MNKITKKAFSLTEISIVILIIGILLASVTKGKNILHKSKLRSAQNLTAKSPVNNIYSLAFWYETSMDKSFVENENYQGTFITKWLDINPQSTIKYNAYGGQNSSATNFYYTINSGNVSGPQYIKKGINDIPTLRFDNSGSNNRYVAVDPKIRNQKGKSFTFFMVLRYNGGDGYFLDRSCLNSNNIAVECGSSVTAGMPLFSASIDSSKIIHMYFKSRTNQGPLYFSINRSVSENESFIITMQRNYNQNVTTYVNGTKSSNNPSENTGPIDFDAFKIGAHSQSDHEINVDISEVIFFNDQIKNIDRESVEAYLGQKYKIRVNHN